MQHVKNNVTELALFGGEKLFDVPKSTSNLLQPSQERFLEYSKLSFDSHQFTNNGPCVKLLEKRLAQFHDVEYCLTFSSGFWAIVLAIKSLALKGKSEIILPALTYRRMPDLISWLGLTPHYCDVDPVSLSMSVTSVERCINDNTAIILGVHPIVNCCDADGLTSLARRAGLPIVFDSVESVFESLTQGRIGKFGNAECFSMHACKLLNGFGGGYLTTNDVNLYKKLRSLRTFGFIAEDTLMRELGLNAKLNELHAAMALASLDDVESQVQRNRDRYHKYLTEFHDIEGITILPFDETQQCGYKNVVAKLDDKWPLSRDDTLALLNAENILSRNHYFPPLHTRKIQQHFLFTDLKHTNKLCLEYINLPCGHHVSIDDIGQIAGTFRVIVRFSNEINQRLGSNARK